MAAPDDGRPAGTGPSLCRAFRGEHGLEDAEVVIGSAYGVPAADVATELAAFERTLVSIGQQLDTRYPHADDLDTDGLEAVIDLAAWTHAEWVRTFRCLLGEHYGTRRPLRSRAKKTKPPPRRP